MHLSIYCRGLVALFSVLFLSATMAKAGAPSADELKNHLETASQVVDFSHISGSESPDAAEIRVPVKSSVVVRLSCTGGYRGVLTGGFSGLMDLKDTPTQSMSAEEAVKLVENPPQLPDGVEASLAVPYHVDEGTGLVGAPVPYLSVVTLKKAGDYTLLYSIMRTWTPSSASRYVLKIHVTE